MLRQTIKAGRHLAEADADGQNHIDVLENLFGGAGALGAVAPADGQGMVLRHDALAGKTGGHGGLQDFGACGPGPANNPCSPGRRKCRRKADGRRAARARWKPPSSTGMGSGSSGPELKWWATVSRL